jgi:hypothetical protein
MMAKVRLVAVEAINDAREIDDALVRLKALDDRVHAMYLACTPAVAAEYLHLQATAGGPAARWDADALRRKLQAPGVGLLVVEGDAVAQVLLPQERKPNSAKVAELAATLSSPAR